MKKYLTLNNITAVLSYFLTFILVIAGVQAVMIGPLLFDSVTFVYNDAGQTAFDSLVNVDKETFPLWGYFVSGVFGFLLSEPQLKKIKAKN